MELLTPTPVHELDELMPLASPVSQCVLEPSKWRGTKKQLIQQLHVFASAFENIPCGVSMFDSTARLVLSNNAYRTIYGIPAELTLQGTSFRRIIEWHVRCFGEECEKSYLEPITSWMAPYAEKLERREPWTTTHTLSDGRIVRVTCHPMPDGGWVDMHVDVTARRKAAMAVEWMARHDALTGLANRHAFEDRLQTALSKLESSYFTLFWIDIDHFKQVNDTLGHPCGDILLKHVANRLFSVTRENDFVARLGGDEFALIDDGFCSRTAIEQTASRIITAMREPLHIAGNTLQVTASLGIVQAPEHGQ